MIIIIIEIRYESINSITSLECDLRGGTRVFAGNLYSRCEARSVYITSVNANDPTERNIFFFHASEVGTFLSGQHEGVCLMILLLYV